MPDSYEWRMARRAARLAASSGGGLRRAEMAALMGIDEAELRRHVGLAYSRRMLDCIRDYVVAPMAVNRPRPLGWGMSRCKAVVLADGSPPEPRPTQTR